MSGCAHMNPDDFCASCAPDKLREARLEIERMRLALAPIPEVLCLVAQIFDGWHQDGTAWTPHDESVRKRVAEVMAIVGDRSDTACWLIEAPAGAWGWQSVHWWCGQQEGGAEWTADATIAVRFLRREDAEAVLNFLTDQLIEVGGGVRVTEHVFLRRALASGESGCVCASGAECNLGLCGQEYPEAHPDFSKVCCRHDERHDEGTCCIHDREPASAGPAEEWRPIGARMYKAEEPGRETR